MENRFQVLKEQVKISLKSSLEYKANLYSILFFDVILTFTFGGFFFVFGSFISEILNWQKTDMIIYFIVLLIGAKMKWAFSLMFFSQKLLNGDINTVLTKPINVYFFENLQSNSGGTFLTVPVLFVLNIFLCVYFGFDLINIFYANLLLIFGIYYETILINFIESLAFFVKQNRFLVDLFFRLTFANETYTPKLFEKFTKVFYFLSTSIYGFFVIEVLNGRFELISFVLPITILILIIFKILIGVIWKIGLKKYEAFG